jgi:hypothetical protein
MYNDKKKVVARPKELNAVTLWRKNKSRTVFRYFYVEVPAP